MLINSYCLHVSVNSKHSKIFRPLQYFVHYFIFPRKDVFNPIQHGPFRGCSRMGAKKTSLPRICHTYPTMMKLGTVTPYLKKIQKIYESRDTPMSSADISIFSPEISKIFDIKNYKYQILLTFF